MSQKDPFLINHCLPLRKRLKFQDDEKPMKKLKRGRPPKSTTTNDIYCVCKRPYDMTRFMIACDKCNDWFHGECIGISEKQSEFVHLYFCDNCSKITGKQTSWKPNCTNSNCSKPASTDMQYCSKSCEQNQHCSLSTRKLIMFADMDDRARLSRVKEERILAKSKLSIIEKKFALLNKSCKCGYDIRLSWPDHLWNQVYQVIEQNNQILLLDMDGNQVHFKSNTAISTCQQLSQNCNKHKLKISEIEKERAEQLTILIMLERERHQVKARMKKRREDVDYLLD